jgi:hypothetical protein
MQYKCRGSEHLPVAIVAGILWVLYALAFPIWVGVMIARNKAQQAALRRLSRFERDERVAPDYWTSTRPLKERFWLPAVAHLQVCLQQNVILPLLPPPHSLNAVHWSASRNIGGFLQPRSLVRSTSIFFTYAGASQPPSPEKFDIT